jgi:predicted dinucleotide-binding enzyme
MNIAKLKNRQHAIREHAIMSKTTHQLTGAHRSAGARRLAGVGQLPVGPLVTGWVTGRAGRGVSRRGLLRIGAGMALLAAAVSSRAQQQAAPLSIGVIGAGRIGGSVGSRWVRAGHRVFFSSRHPEQLKELVDRLGPRASAGAVAEAVAFGSVILLAVPYGALPAIGSENHAGLAGKIVLDACNPIAARDGDTAREAMQNGIGATSLKYLQGARLVRVFNPVPYRYFEGDARPTEAGEPIGMPLAGDDPEAISIASRLVHEAGAEPVVVPLARAMEFAPGTALFGKALPVSELRSKLGVTR